MSGNPNRTQCTGKTEEMANHPEFHNRRPAIWKKLLVLLPALGFLAGCAIHPLRYAAANSISLENRAGVRLIDPNDGPYSIEVIRRNDGSRDYLWEIDSQIKQDNPCRIKYHKMYSTKRFIVVEGRVGNAEKKYPIVLDTGASQAIFVKTTHILNNNLPIYPMETDKLDLNGYALGLCYLPKVQIGNVTLVDWSCLYLERHTKPGLFGLSIAKDDSKDDTIIVGLPALREFKYIVFDSIRKEVEFSHNKLFEPRESDIWEQYQFSIEEDFHGNAFLFVKIPIAGEETELQLDTGSGRGLAIAEELWEGIRKKIRNVKLKKGRDSYPYIGQLACRRGVIPKLEVGDRTVKNAKISIFPDDSPLVEDCQGLLGMQYFQDTVMVLDFERNLMWVKNPQSEYFTHTTL